MKKGRMRQKITGSWLNKFNSFRAQKKKFSNPFSTYELTRKIIGKLIGTKIRLWKEDVQQRGFARHVRTTGTQSSRQNIAYENTATTELGRFIESLAQYIGSHTPPKY